VLGGGTAALSKARLLLDAGARVTLFAERPGPATLELAAAGRLVLSRRQPTPAELTGAALVIVATGDARMDAAAAALARAARVPVNVVDRPALSDFQMPAIVDRWPVLVAISTGGTAPALARWLRGRIEAALPSGLERLIGFAGAVRPAIAARHADAAARRRQWDDLLDGPAALLALAGRQGEAMASVCAGLAEARPAGIVHLAGVDTGAADLLTLRAHRLLLQADAVLHDRAIGAEVLALARREAELIEAEGRHVEGLLVRLARQGKRVVRLFARDPRSDARAEAEFAHLRANAIAVELVPGVAAAEARAVPAAPARRAAAS
jgi:uroporphyrin-III C-methyltransferase/precorrin-2 dehydrogenase/sirohydrochlorin ferrochelatase